MGLLNIITVPAPPLPPPPPTWMQRLEKWAIDNLTPSHVVVREKGSQREYMSWSRNGWATQPALAITTPLWRARQFARKEQARCSYAHWIVTIEPRPVNL
jgi:hypothetical protein